MRKALLIALLQPAAKLIDAENRGDGTMRMALFEEQKSLPWSAVWDFYCSTRDVPVGIAWLDVVRRHESSVLEQRKGVR